MIKILNINSPKQTSLCKLSQKHRSDKFNVHGYTGIYYELLKDWKNKSFNMLEIGIANGSSIRMWHEFFPNAQIYCIDVKQNSVDSVKKMERVFAYKLDCAIRSDWQNIFLNKLENTMFDLVIDDGGHHPIEQWTAFDCLGSKVNKNGFYVIEDLHAPWAFIEKRHAFLDYVASFIASDLLNKKHEYDFLIKNKIIIMKKQN